MPCISFGELSMIAILSFQFQSLKLKRILMLFNQMLNQAERGNQKGRKLEVILPDANPQAFEMLLSYIYTDRIHPTKKGVYHIEELFTLVSCLHTCMG